MTTGEWITAAMKIIAFWTAAVAGGATIYGIVKTIKPGFDEKLWRK